MSRLKALLAASLLFLFLFSPPARADQFESASYKLLEPVVNPGGFSSTNNYRLFGSIGHSAPGRGDSTSYQLKSDFLYFPAPSAAAPSPTPTPAATPTGGGPYLEIFKRFREVIRKVVVRCSGGDLNCDGLVDLYDAGILFYWWGKPVAEPKQAGILAAILSKGFPTPDINKDKMVVIFDLSIMLAYWSGG